MFLVFWASLVLAAPASGVEALWELDETPKGIVAHMHLKPGPSAEPCAFQFDLAYPSEFLKLEGAFPGPAAEAARKDTVIQPSGPGMVRVVVAGLNQTPIEPGVAVVLRFAYRDGVGPGQGESGAWACTGLRVANPMGAAIDAEVSGLPGGDAFLDSGASSERPVQGWGCGRVDSGGTGSSAGAGLLIAGALFTLVKIKGCRTRRPFQSAAAGNGGAS
jgi:hypothetical protein